MTRTLHEAAYVASYIIAVLVAFASLYPVSYAFYGGTPEHPLTNLVQALAILAVSCACYGLHVLLGKKLNEPQ